MPMRRPLKRNRLNAYAASAPRIVEKRAVAPAMITELSTQLRYGASALPPPLVSTLLCSRLPKLCNVTWVGITCAPESELSRLNADETTNTTGNRATTTAPSASRCRHQLPLKLTLNGRCVVALARAAACAAAVGVSSDSPVVKPGPPVLSSG